MIREEILKRNLSAFVANGSILPRESGISSRPMKNGVPFRSPKEMEVEMELPHRGKINGMGIPCGITLIVGGGYHLSLIHICALDAVELMNVGVNYLREHVTSKARIHYTTDSGGFSPNIVPPRAGSWYFVRAPHISEVKEILERVRKVAEGACLMKMCIRDRHCTCCGKTGKHSRRDRF